MAGSNMNNFGVNIGVHGVVIQTDDWEKQMKRKGKCHKCENILYKRRFLKMIPITVEGKVHNGICLTCNPPKVPKKNMVLPAACNRDFELKIEESGGSGPDVPPPQKLAPFRNRSNRSLPIIRRLPAEPVLSHARRTTGELKTNILGGDRFSLRDITSVQPRVEDYPDGAGENSSYPVQQNKDSDSNKIVTKPQREDDPGNNINDKTDPKPPVEDNLGDTGADSTCSVQISNYPWLSNDHNDIIKTVNCASHSDVDKLQNIFYKISNLTLGRERYNEIYNLGTVKFIIDTMNKVQHEGPVMISALGALHNLCSFDETQFSIINHPCIPTIVETIKIHNDVALQKNALAVLSKVSTKKESICCFLSSTGLKVIVDVMIKYYIDSVEILEYGCLALENLILSNTDVKKDVSALGGIDVVISAMMVHIYNSDFQERALKLLRDVCEEEDEIKLKVADGELGGVDAVITAMQEHRNNEVIQEIGACNLSNLAIDSEIISNVGDKGGIEIIIRAMLLHSDNANLQKCSCRALWTLCENEWNRAVAINENVIKLVIDALRGHVETSAVLESGFDLISRLATNDDMAKIEIVEEGVDEILFAMVRYRENQKVYSNGCDALRNLFCEETADRLIMQGVVEVISEVVLSPD